MGDIFANVAVVDIRQRAHTLNFSNRARFPCRRS
jgi:hypothetical protein